MQKNKFNLKDIINTLIKLVFIFLIGIAVLNMFVFKDNLHYKYNYIFITIFCILYLALIFGIAYLKDKLKVKISKRKVTIFKYITLGFIFIVQIIYALILYRDIGFDVGMVYGCAVDLMEGKLTHPDYFSMYGNNIFLLLVLEIIFRIFNLFKVKNFLFVAILFNIIMVDLAVYYVYKICKELFREKYSSICFLLSIPILGFTPYIAVVYSDTLSFLFPILIFYNYLCYKKSADSNKKTKYIFFITLTTIIGILIKPTNVIMLIAILILEFINFIIYLVKGEKERNTVKIDKNSIKKIILRLVIIIATILVIYGGFNLYKNIRLGKYISKEDFKNNSFPYTHFIMMGLKPTNIEGKYYGFYLEEDVIATKSQIGMEAKKIYNIAEIKNRLSKLGIKGYISYLYDKYTCTISDGTFFYGKEGHFYTSTPHVKGKIARFIQSYAFKDGIHYETVTVNIMQSYWGIILILTLISTVIFIFKKESTNNINVLRLSIIGIILFILIFEARSRYLLNYVPVFIIIATYAIISIYDLILNNKIKEKSILKLKDNNKDI